MDAKVIEELKAAHGSGLHLIEHDGVEVVAKRPGGPQYRRWKQLTLDEKRRIDAGATLVRDCVVHPAAAELQALIDERPGLVDTFAGKLVELAGASQEATVTPL